MGRVIRPELDSDQALRLLQEAWLSNFAHDLAGPLQVTRGYTRLVLEDRDNQLSTSHRRYLGTVLDNVGKLAGLSAELEDFPLAGKFELKQFELRPFLHDAIAGVSPHLKHAEIRVVQQPPDDLGVHISAGPIVVIGDRAQLLDAMQNLLNTAVEFTSPTAALDLTVREETEKIAIEFSTAGPLGVSPEIATKIDSSACNTWRRHGGKVRFTLESSDGLLIRCELPDVRRFECL